MIGFRNGFRSKRTLVVVVVGAFETLFSKTERFEEIVQRKGRLTSDRSIALKRGISRLFSSTTTTTAHDAQSSASSIEKSVNEEEKDYFFDPQRSQKRTKAKDDETKTRTRNKNKNESIKSEVRGSCQAMQAPFVLTSKDAKRKFEKWLSSDVLRPREVYDKERRRDGWTSENEGRVRARATLVPFWKFSTKFKVTYKGKVGFSVKGSGENLEWQEVEEWRDFNDGKEVAYDFEKDALARQFATFSVRPDFARELQPPKIISKEIITEISTNGHEDDEEDGEEEEVHVLPFELKRSFAWTLALSNIRDDLREKASKELKETFSTTHVKDVIVRMEVVSRDTPIAIYLPAYFLEFTHGFETEKKETIRHIKRSAIVCGTSGNVSCDEIACSKRAVAIGGTFGLSMSAFATYIASGVTDYGVSLLSGVISSALLSHYAKTLDVRTRNQQEKDQEDIVKEYNAFNFATDQSINWLDEAAQLARDDAEWSRWRRTKREDWVNEDRKDWAFSIWESQIYRKRERSERREELETQRAHKLEAERRAEEKRMKWGDDWDRASRKAANRKGMPTDSQSFYKILELGDKLNEATIEEIKESYRRLAQRWHPDKKGGKVEKFQTIQKAYLTLGNKKRRETYDQV